MAEVYYFFDSGAGAAVTESAWYLAMRTLVATGVLYNKLNELAPSGDSGGMRVFVNSGQAWNEGHFYQNDASLQLAIGAAPVAPNSRIDRVVLKLDRTAKTIALGVKAGVAANPGVAPALQQDVNIWELPIAQVMVAGGAATITAANVVDERVYAEAPGVAPAGALCGFAGAGSPKGWLLADGSLKSRITYSRLFTAIGTVHGAGDGVTTFQLPDYRGRFMLGAGAGAGLTNRARGAAGGAESGIIAATHMPPHHHPINANNLTHHHALHGVGNAGLIVPSGAALTGFGAVPAGGIRAYADNSWNTDDINWLGVFFNSEDSTYNNDPFGIMPPFGVDSICVKY